MSRTIRRALCLLAVLTLLAAQTAMAASMDVYFNASSKVYRSPSQKSASMNVEKGTKAELLAINGAWAQVRRGDATAYCLLSNLNLQNRLTGYTAEGAYLYTKPSTSSSSVGPAQLNTKVYVIGKENGFYRVQNKDGSITGYVKTDAISATKYAEKSTETVTRIEGYTAEGAYLYAKASTSSASIGPAPLNMKVYVVGSKGDFYIVQNKDASITGYAKKSMISRTKYSKKTQSVRAVGYTAEGAYLYAKADADSDRIGPTAMNTKVYVVGLEGEFFRVENADGTLSGYVKTSQLSSVKYSASTPKVDDDPKSQVVKMDWFDGGSEVLNRSEYATIYDIYSGQTIRIKRMGGSSHADVEPATSEDTEKLKNACGGEYTWQSRPVILIVDDLYIACAIYPVPHGDETIEDNDFDGQFCLHMLNSRTHGTDTVNPQHQQAIEFAYAWAHD